MNVIDDLPEPIQYLPYEDVNVIYKNTTLTGKIIGMPYINRFNELTYMVEFEHFSDLIPTKMQVPRVHYLIKKIEKNDI
jgi:hypothetical protein